MILMNVLTQVFTVLVNVLETTGTYNEYFSKGMAYLGAGIAVFTGIGPAIGEGNIGAKAMEAIGRQPEARSKIQLSMIIGQCVAETTGLYGLIIAFILAFK